MEVHIISLFPESIRPYFESSIMKKAQEKGLFSYFLYNLSDWSVKNTRRVDDKPYGGGAGTIITIEPLSKCIREILEKQGEMPIFLMSPKGEIIKQEILEKNTKYAQILVICGHYEGIDDRIFQLFNISEISIGEYVLSSGELAGMVFVDGLIRLIDGVLSPESLEEESYSKKLHRKKEYPQYSRPQIFEDIEVPPVLLSGNQKFIEEWKRKYIKE